MLETIFRRTHHLRRLRANPLGAILDQYVEYLIGRGHTTNVVHQGCDRASAKVFGGNRTIFGPRGPSVPTTTMQKT
jgi:hypothetical protein